MTEWRANAVLTLLPGQIYVKLPLMLRLRFPGQICVRFPLLRCLTPAVMLSVVFFDLTFPFIGTGKFPPLLSLPVGVARMNHRLTITRTLNFRSFVAGPIKMVSLISAIPFQVQLLPPDVDVFALVIFPVLFLTEPIGANCPGGDNDMCMGVIPRWVILVMSPMDGNNRTQTMVHKITLCKITSDLDPPPGRQLIRKREYELSGCSGILARLSPLNFISEILEILKFQRSNIG